MCYNQSKNVGIISYRVEEGIFMNKKEWDAMINAAQNSKRIADTYKTILPETSSSENGVSSFLKKM